MSLDCINVRSIQTLLRGENDSKQSDEIQARIQARIRRKGSRYYLRMTNNRQKATKVKCKRDESITNSQYLWNIFFSRRSINFQFCWSSLEVEHNASPKSTRRNVQLNKKNAFGTPRLPDLLCKHWFTTAVWNFYRWVADVPPRETSPAGRSQEKRLFSQAIYFRTFPALSS